MQRLVSSICDLRRDSALAGHYRGYGLQHAPHTSRKTECMCCTGLSCDKLGPVGKYQELRLRILQGGSDANINFDELRHFLQWLGFEERTRASHHIFRRPGVRELINLQREGNKAKVYQVRQARQVVVRYGLEGTKE